MIRPLNPQEGDENNKHEYESEENGDDIDDGEDVDEGEEDCEERGEDDDYSKYNGGGNK